MAVEEAAESCGSHAAAAAAAASGGAAGPATSSSSAAAAAQARKQQQQQRHKIEVYTEVLRRLHDAGLPDARAPGFDDELWNHFNRLPARYAMDVNVERAEDVLTHKRLLEQAKDPAQRPAFAVRAVQVSPILDGNQTDADSNTAGEEVASRPLNRHQSIHPPPAFGSFTNLEALALEASKSHQDHDSTSDNGRSLYRPMHEITFSTIDKPKLLSELTSLLGELGLNIQEAHAFSTNDGYSLDVFVVVGWHDEETEDLVEAVQKEIGRIEETQAWSSSHSWSTPVENMQIAENSAADHVEIPTDGASEWEIDVKLLKFGNKVASGSYGDLYRGTYCSQDVAIKVLKPERVNADMQREFAQEVYIMSFIMDPTKILIWNVRGLNSRNRQNAVRTLVDSARVDVVCLQETKMPFISQRDVLSMLGADFNQFIFLPSVGASGGILVSWKREVGVTGLTRVDNHSVSVQFSSRNNHPWWLTCVYGPQGTEQKIEFLQELRDIRQACLGPWSIAGDYNLIYREEDKSNDNFNQAMMGRFRHFINDLGLKEIPLHGRKFTWTNNHVSVKLDRVLCSVEWEELFSNCLLQSASSDDSDHCPLILGMNDIKPGKRRFHFESFWPKLEGFQEAVEEAWNAVPVVPCPFETLSRKLQATSQKLQSWSQKNVGHVKTQLGLAREVLHQLEIAQDSRVLTPAEMWLRNSLKKHTLALSSLLRTITRLRSRISWLSDGDANTALFHAQARYRKKKNFVAQLMLNGQVYTEHEKKAEIIDDFYSNLLGQITARGNTVNLAALGFSSHDLSELDAPFSEEEVWNTVKLLPPDKAPGPDGFTGRFYRVCWPIIKKEVMEAFSAVWSRKFRNFETLNSAFITLLPKTEEANCAKDFRPISLVHSFAKLVTKLLANRLACHLQQMVSPNQSAFIKGRFIQDNFMLVQQTARFLHQHKLPRFLLKLDISKAFDSVSWAFLLEVMQQLGFGQIWRDIISGLLGSSSTRVLLNGIPGEVILHRRGLRQGDPLSPMLFILVMDVLGHMVALAERDGLLQPLSTRAIQHRISLYADDVVLFLRPEIHDIEIIMGILDLFGEASGLKTNVQKSSAYPIQCGQEEIQVIQYALPCEVSEFPCRYLGLPLSLKKLTKAQTQPIIDRIANQLPGWKADLLSRAGRAIQVQYVMTAMLVYLIMAIDLPQWAIKAIDKIRRGFLWRGRKEARGGHCLVAWGKVMRPRELGGLGISDLKSMGWALRMRWLWLHKTEPHRPWSMFPIQVPQQARAFFAMAIVTEVGDGTRTLFWEDRWLHGQRIIDVAPRLHALVPKRTTKKRTVAEALSQHLWISDVKRASSIGELVEYFNLWDLLMDFPLQPEIEDVHIWRLSPSGQYSAKSAYEHLFQGSIPFRPWERIWKTWAPGKCKFFLWLVEHDRCWTADRLARRGLPCPERCPLCDQEQETINHLLVSCSFARQYWYSLLCQVGLQQIAPQATDMVFDDWWDRVWHAAPEQQKKGLNSLIVLGAWVLWTHRNSCVFDGAAPSIARALNVSSEERRLWEIAGARSLSSLTTPTLS